MALSLRNLVGQLKNNPSRGHMPVKRSINLAATGEKPIQLATAVPAIVAIVLLAALFSKFAVVDRFQKVSRTQEEVAALQRQLELSEEALAQYAGLTEEYAHYTYSGMTEEELTRTDRVQVLDMIRRLILPAIANGSWTLTGNQLILNISGSTLESINLMIQRVEEDPLVDYCTITTATQTDFSGRSAQSTDPVTANVVVFLKQGDLLGDVAANSDTAAQTEDSGGSPTVSSAAERTSRKRPCPRRSAARRSGLPLWGWMLWARAIWNWAAAW